MSDKKVDMHIEDSSDGTAKRAAIYYDRLINHASIVSEKEYQKFLLERLEKDNGYVVRKASNYDRYFAVDREMLFKFLNDTQPETMDYLRKIYKADLEETIINFINTETTGGMVLVNLEIFDEYMEQYRQPRVPLKNQLFQPKGSEK